MKRLYTFFVAILFSFTATAQGWTEQELSAANTARGEKAMTIREREAVKYINLARMFPRRFVELELADYYGTESTGYRVRLSDYRLTLVAELMEREACEPLHFDASLIDEARCLAAEQAENGETGHERHRCTVSYNGECCSYGPLEGRDIALQLLIDDGVASVGHRQLLLNKDMRGIAVATDEHPKFGYVTVIDMSLRSGGDQQKLRYYTAKDIAKAARDRYFALMTRHVEPDLVKPFPSGTPVVDVSTSMHTTTQNGVTTRVDRETRVHADGRRQIIEITTTNNLDGVGNKKRRVWVE